MIWQKNMLARGTPGHCKWHPGWNHCASRSSKGSIDADFGLVFTKSLIQKNGLGPRAR